jgi:hypothetical protein
MKGKNSKNVQSSETNMKQSMIIYWSGIFLFAFEKKFLFQLKSLCFLISKKREG